MFKQRGLTGYFPNKISQGSWNLRRWEVLQPVNFQLTNIAMEHDPFSSLMYA